MFIATIVLSVLLAAAVLGSGGAKLAAAKQYLSQGNSGLGRVVHPHRQNGVQVPHELGQPHPVFCEAERVGAAFRVCDAEPEQARCKDAVGRVVLEPAPLRSVGKLPRLEAHGVDNMVTLGESVLEFGAVYRKTVEPFRIHAVDVLPRPARRPALEADVVEQRPITQADSITERTAVEVDHLPTGWFKRWGRAIMVE